MLRPLSGDPKSLGAHPPRPNAAASKSSND